MLIRARHVSFATAMAAGIGMLTQAAAHAAGNTLTVDNSVATCGTASGSAVYCTIASAVKYAHTGDTVVVNPGHGYTGGTTVKVNGLTITANGAVTITGGAHAFTVDGYSNVTISGFTIANTTGSAFDLGDRSAGATPTAHLVTDGLQIRDNTVTGAGGASAGPGVTGTVVGHGISAYYVTGSTFAGNHLDRDNGHGLWLMTGSTGNTVTGNEASGNWNPNARTANGIDVVAANNTLTGNAVHDNQDSGIQFYTGADHGVAVNNLAWHNGDHGIDDLNATGGVVVSNTVYDNCTAGINVEGTSTGYTVEDNIAVDNGTDTTCIHGPAGIGINADGQPGQPGQVRIADSAITDAATVADHNLVYNPITGVLVPVSDSRGLGAHDIVADPRFADPDAADFHIGTTSPAVGAADPAAPDAPTVDYDGTARPDPASVGAFEG